ncbi:MAG: hypothetical protein ACK5X0_15205 [Rhodospirillales bacterium]|jgi:hypothetical protein
MVYYKTRFARNAAISHGPLFDWADQHQHAKLTLSAKRLSRRFRLQPATARVVSELAFGAKGAR